MLQSLENEYKNSLTEEQEAIFKALSDAANNADEYLAFLIEKAEAVRQRIKSLESQIMVEEEKLLSLQKNESYKDAVASLIKHGASSSDILIAERIINAASIVTGVEIFEIKGQNRSAAIVFARHLVAYMMHKKCRSSLGGYSSIGRYLGRDHSTIIHAVRNVEKNKGRFSRQIKAIENLIKNMEQAPVKDAQDV